MKTQKSLFAILSLLIITSFTSVFASEEKKNEIYVGYGTFSCVPIVVGIYDALGNAISGDTDSSSNMSGVIQAGYNRSLFSHLLLGANVSYESFSFESDNYNSENDYALLSLQGKITLQYGLSKLKLYHAASFGPCLLMSETHDDGIKETDTGYSYIFNFTLLGLKVDIAKGFGVFADLNLGSGGILSVGASYKF